MSTNNKVSREEVIEELKALADVLNIPGRYAAYVYTSHLHWIKAAIEYLEEDDKA